MAAGRRAAALLLLGLLAGAVVLSVAPGDPGALRLRGVGVLWWYTLLAAPLTALAATVPVLAARSGPSSGSVAFWLSPVVPAVVATRIFGGTPDAPVVALAVALAPLLALLVSQTVPPVPADAGTRILGAASAALVLGAGLGVLDGLGALLHLPRAAALAVPIGCAVVAAVLPCRPAAVVRELALGFGGVGLIVLIAAVGLAVGAAPWAAWRDVATRPALTFDPASAAVVEGRALLRATTLTFTEAHRITARAPGVFRVTEGTRRHEWRLRPGDVLELRPGDRLTLEAGTRLLFEAGRRVPSAPVSGVVWADPVERGTGGTAARLAGLVVSVVGGALAFVPPGGAAGARVVLGAALAVGLVLASACLGIWSVAAAPDLALGVPPLVAPLALPTLSLGARWGRAWLVLCALALLLLLTAAAAALAGVARAGAPAGAHRGRALGLAVPALAVAAAVWPGDPWPVGVAGLGLAASAVAAPRLGGGAGGATLAGALAGGLAFGVVTLAAPWLPAWADAVGAYPALVAVPLAVAVSRGVRVAAAERD